MLLHQAIEQKKQELINSQKYRVVEYSTCEKILMSKNTNKSYFLAQSFDNITTQVQEIKCRFTELDDDLIDAIKVIFKVKLPRKRKFQNLEVYYKIIK